MIDTYLRDSYQKVLVDPVLKWIDVSPNLLTLLGLITGILVTPFTAFSYSMTAIFFLIVSGYFDTLDGSVARVQNRSTPKGAMLDIISDRVVEFSIIMGLFLADPVSRALLSLLMLGSVLVCITTFLVVGIFKENRSEKGFHYSVGIIERSEAFLLFGAMILFPSLFTPLATLFTLLVTFTAALRLREELCQE